MALFEFAKYNRLAQSLKKGDTRAAEKLYEELFNKVFGFCMNKTSNRHIAEDLSQEIFLKLIDRIESFDAKRGNFLTWFWQLARNTTIDHYRKQKETHFSDIEEIQLEESSKYSGQEKMDSQVELKRIQIFLKSISQEEQDLFELHFVADLKYKEISKILNKPEVNLRVAIGRLKKKIQEHLK